MTRAPLLAVRDLRVHFPATPHAIRAVDGVDLDVGSGETVGLVGESGCGKTTLARAIVGIEPGARGSVRLAGRELIGLARRERRSLCGALQMVFQDPATSLDPRMTIAGILGEALRLHERPVRAEVDVRVCELMERVGLDARLRHRHPHEFSGGQKQRVCIARALAVRPLLIVCDEAVSALDVSIQAQILNLLADLQDEFGLAYLFISHDLAVVRHVADRIAVMYLGQIVEEGRAETVLAGPKHPYTRSLRGAVPSLEPGVPPIVSVRGDVPSAARPPGGCRFHTRCPEAFERCARESPPRVAVGDGTSRCFLADSAPGGEASA
ncbi:MAG: ABC transporter ATP-binding protein [Myxococcales bacterium]|nr:ABC transporter ATP-binding protein [Myxococcales bacterium]